MSTAAELIGLAGVISLEISRDMTFDELVTLIEFLGLLRHNLEIVRQRKVITKIENKIEHKKDAKENKESKS